MDQNTELANRTVIDAALATDEFFNSITPKTDFLPGLRIAQKVIDTDGGKDRIMPGNWFFMDQDYGPEIKVYVGPWRYAARRFKDDNLDAMSLNGHPANVYDAASNMWKSTVKTKVFQEILDKVIPDSQKPLVSNCVGMDVLFFLPEHNLWAYYFIAKSAAKPTMTNVKEECIRNRGAVAILGTKRGPGKFTYWIPTIRFAVDEAPNWPPDRETQWADFINVPHEASPTTESRPR